MTRAYLNRLDLECTMNNWFSLKNTLAYFSPASETNREKFYNTNTIGPVIDDF
jgi:hypothetical protein